MANNLADKVTQKAWPALASAALRVAFGIIWVINAAFVWSPRFASNYVGYLHNAADGQPAWSAFWFNTWIDIVTPRAELFVWLTRLATTALAFALLFGFARRTIYVLGALYSLLIWSTAEGFGGPYAIGASNMGVGISYVLIFAVLIAINTRSATSPYSIDYYIESVWPRWGLIAEWRVGKSARSPQPVSWAIQLPILAGVVAVTFFLIAGLQSSMNVNAPTPAAAAAAVSPLSIMSKEPVENPFDATLPPVPDGDTVELHINSSDENISIASGVQYQAWPFEGTVPGPVIHVRQGQTVKVRLTNTGTMPHSIDFHAAFTPPNLSFADIKPGEQIEFDFVAHVPGAFVYHCGTDPVLLHMANGMFGAIIVDPADNPLPPADKEYVLVQSEWYTRQVSGSLMGPDFEKMSRIQPDLMAFNGIAFQYMDHPLTARPNERVRLYMVNAGPSRWSAFHVIGTIFDRVYVDGDPDHYLSGIQTYTVAPGGGAVFDVVIPEPGQYPFVDHAFAHLDMGAVGILDIREPNTEHGEPNISRDESQASTAPAVDKPAEGPYEFNRERGEALYTTHCAACHQPGGEGLPGVFPPLKDDPAVLDPDATKHIDVILNGMQGEAIDGVMYSAPMQAFRDVLDDVDIADIVNHERTSWGNDAPLIEPEDVEELRENQTEN